MTLFKPTLRVQRLEIRKDGKSAFNAQFHAGLNVIRGENSSGKSTILDFLFYGLGGDLTSWREAAVACDEVIVEAFINGHPVTIIREVSPKSGRPMRVFAGPLDVALSQKDGWSIYPYRRSPQKESFSQVMFRWLEMPEVTGDASSNITMHQVLRLLYSDQLSPVDRLFRSESFDNGLIRQTVGDLLCGAFDDAMYRNEIRLREVKKDLEVATQELSSLFSAFSEIKHNLTTDWVNAEHAIIVKKLDDVQREILVLEERIFSGEVSDGLSLKDQQAAYQELRAIQESLASIQQEFDDLQLEVADSDLYIAGLEAKLRALSDSSVTARSLQGISFLYCPACFAPIDNTDAMHACHLCKSPFDQERAQSRVLLLINDVSQQLKQSRLLQEERLNRLKTLEKDFLDQRTKWEGANRKYQLINRSPSTELRSRARELHRQAGYLERQLEDLNGKAGIIKRIDVLSRRKADLTAERSYLEDMIDAGQRSQERQLRTAYTRIADNVRTLLHADLARQDTFQKADSISFNFEEDRISVNGESFFSASSMVYLKNSFMVAFLQASMQDPKFRHPRFLILDTVEDKGMEPERSHNFQRIMRSISDKSSVEHQIIYATAMIAPELDETDYVVGRFFTHDERTLKF